MASTIAEEQAGNPEYQSGHMGLIFEEGFSFSGYERNTLYLNDGGGRFKDISGVSGVDSILDGRSATLADFDNDGDLDLFVTSIQGKGHQLFRYNVGQNNGFIRLTVEGRASGRDAFGALVRVKTDHGIQSYVKSGGSGFLAQHDPRILIGLGSAKQADWVEIGWPSGATTRLGPLESGASLKIIEGKDEPTAVSDAKAALPDPLSAQEAVWALLNLKQGQPLPKLNLTLLGPEGLKEPGVQLPDGPAFINLWATFCGPCRREMPELEKLRPAFEANGIRLVGLTLDTELDGVYDFARTLGVTYPIYALDSSDVDSIFRDQVVIPVSILTDEEGRLQQVFSGWSPQTARAIEAVLSN